MDKNFPLTGWGSVAVHAGHKQDPTYSHLFLSMPAALLYTMKQNRACGVLAEKKKDLFTPDGAIPLFVKQKKKLQHWKHSD